MSENGKILKHRFNKIRTNVSKRARFASYITLAVIISVFAFGACLAAAADMQDVRYQVQYMPFKRFCEAHQLPVTFATAPGGHGFGYWEPTVRQILHWFKDLHQQECHRDAYSKKQAVQ